VKEIRDILHGAFGVKEPPKSERVIPEDKTIKTPSERQPIVDIYSAVSAQRFYDPSFKALAPPKAEPPTTQEAKRGTATQMSMQGAWGTPPEEK